MWNLFICFVYILVPPQIYHPFVCGPWNRIKQELVDKYGVRINVPPPSVNRDEITVTGDKEGVMAAVQVLSGIYEEKKAKCQQVSIEVRKTQHKYIIGQQANNLYEILDKVCGLCMDLVISQNAYTLMHTHTYTHISTPTPLHCYRGLFGSLFPLLLRLICISLFTYKKVPFFHAKAQRRTNINY